MFSFYNIKQQISSLQKQKHSLDPRLIILRRRIKEKIDKIRETMYVNSLSDDQIDPKEWFKIGTESSLINRKQNPVVMMFLKKSERLKKVCKKTGNRWLK